MNELAVGDFVQWNSIRRNRNGIRRRTGRVLKMYERMALVRPDKGQGNTQLVGLGRLKKIGEGYVEESK